MSQLACVMYVTCVFVWVLSQVDGAPQRLRCYAYHHTPVAVARCNEWTRPCAGVGWQTFSCCVSLMNGVDVRGLVQMSTSMSVVSTYLI